MSLIILTLTLIMLSTIVAFVIIAKGTPEPTVASMLRRKDLRDGDNR
jgi:hypothetical protein